MIKLTVEINVKNHKEIIELNKGATAAKLAGLFGNSRNMVEEEIKKQVIPALKGSLERELKSNGVKAEVSVN